MRRQRKVRPEAPGEDARQWPRRYHKRSGTVHGPLPFSQERASRTSRFLPRALQARGAASQDCLGCFPRCSIPGPGIPAPSRGGLFPGRAGGLSVAAQRPAQARVSSRGCWRPASTLRLSPSRACARVGVGARVRFWNLGKYPGHLQLKHPGLRVRVPRAVLQKSDGEERPLLRLRRRPRGVRQAPGGTEEPTRPSGSRRGRPSRPLHAYWPTELRSQFDFGKHTQRDIGILEKYITSSVTESTERELCYAKQLRNLSKKQQPNRNLEEEYRNTSCKVFFNSLGTK